MEMGFATTSFEEECIFGKLRRCTRNTVSQKKNLLLRNIYPGVYIPYHLNMYLPGPVVRINPRRLHIKDPYYYDEIYTSSTRKREKNLNFLVSFRVPSSITSAVSHDHNRVCWGFLNSFFSKRSMMEPLPQMHEKNSKLVQRFEKAHHDDDVLRLGNTVAAFTANSIS